MWLCPEKQYMVADIDRIIHTTSFSLEKDENFFFVLEKAETLTDACANKLLKTLEEPPQGYHFIIIATNADAIIPTIRSRCALTTLSHSDDDLHPLLKHFQPSHYVPFEFEKDLKAATLSEHDTARVMDSFLAFLCKQQLAQPDDIYYDAAIAYVEQSCKRLPQPGSSLLFWKNFYINFPRTTPS